MGVWNMDIVRGRVTCLVEEPAGADALRGMYAMAGDEKPPVRRDATRSAGKAQGDRPVERPFDMWLQKQLHAMYDEIASEPLPDELIGLIDEAKKKDSPPDSSGG